MNVKQLFALSALALATGAVMAQTAPDRPVTRAEVRQSVLAAVANGTMPHAGEAGPEEMTPYKAQLLAPSTVTRAQEKASVLQAVKDGTMPTTHVRAPEEDMMYERAHPSTSTLTRGEVKAETRLAEANGALMPAGEGLRDVAAPLHARHGIFARKAPKADQDVASNGSK